jgi:hypothetical protein
MNAAVTDVADRVHDRVYDGVGIDGVYEWIHDAGSDHFQERQHNLFPTQEKSRCIC